jgi:steroid delta-isomerase-like uncharacterized protein
VHPTDARTVAQSYFDRLTNMHDVSFVEQLFTGDIAFHDPAILPNGQANGHDEVKRFFSTFFKAFPDVHFTIEDMLAENDRVAVRFTWTGTHQASFLGVYLTKRHVSVPGIDIFHIVDDKISEVRVAFDRLQLIEQLSGITRPL